MVEWVVIMVVLLVTVQQSDDRQVEAVPQPAGV